MNPTIRHRASRERGERRAEQQASLKLVAADRDAEGLRAGPLAGRGSPPVIPLRRARAQGQREEGEIPETARKGSSTAPRAKRQVEDEYAARPVP